MAIKRKKDQKETVDVVTPTTNDQSNVEESVESMSDSTKDNQAGSDNASDDQLTAETTGDASTHSKEEQVALSDEDDQASSDLDDIDSLDEQVAKFNTLHDQHLRLMAEYDNFRRRTRQEKESLYDQSVADVIKAWLPVVDNLDRALQNEIDETVKQGLDMIKRQADQVLEQFKVEPVGEVGETFDPNLHEAVMHIEDASYPEQSIIEVFEKGYKRDEQVLRHAIVKVAN